MRDEHSQLQAGPNKHKADTHEHHLFELAESHDRLARQAMAQAREVMDEAKRQRQLASAYRVSLYRLVEHNETAVA